MNWIPPWQLFVSRNPKFEFGILKRRGREGEKGKKTEERPTTLICKSDSRQDRGVVVERRTVANKSGVRDLNVKKPLPP